VSRSRRGLLRAGIGLAISIVAIWFVLQQVDLTRTGDVLSHAAPAWLALMLGCMSLDLAIRGLRWQRLLAPIHRVSYGRMLGYLLIGYAANNVLPARLGELVRSHYVGDREGISRTTTLGTVVVERVIDTAVVVSVASLAILVLHVRGIVASAVLFGLAVSALLVVGLALGVAAHRLPGAERVTVYIGRWPRIGEVAGKLRGGLAVAGRPRTLAEALVLTVIAWGSTVIAVAAAGQAIGVQLTIAEAALLASGVALAAAVPAGPGNLGTFDLAAVAIASTFGIDRDTAFALALVSHASVLLVTTVGGSISLLRLGWGRRPPVPITEAELG
jgi:glycosyltransferase 2 family protein